MLIKGQTTFLGSGKSWSASYSSSPSTLARLIGFQANASSLDHCDLENAADLHVDSIAEWGELMGRFNRDYGVKILGGCCGTSIEHLQYLVGQRTG